MKAVKRGLFSGDANWYHTINLPEPEPIETLKVTYTIRLEDKMVYATRMSNLFKTHVMDEAQTEKFNTVGIAFEELLEKLIALCPEGRELAITKTKLEEACFFAKKAIAVTGKPA